MSGGEQDITALALALRPGAYHRAPGIQALRQRLRTLIMKCMGAVFLAGRRGTQTELDLCMKGPRMED